MGPFKRLFLLPLLSLISASVAFIPNHSFILELIAKSAWIICAVLIGALIWNLQSRFHFQTAKDWLKTHTWGLLASIFVLMMIIIHDQAEHKVLLDELTIESSAQYLLHHNEYRTPVYAHYLEGSYQIYGANPDKRPPLFSFLISIAHRFFGYHPFNGHLLNYGFGFIFFIFLAQIGNRFSGKAGQIIAVLGFATLPIASQVISSVHFETLYLALIAVLFYVLQRFLEKGHESDIKLSYLIAILIALTRYEGILFLIPTFLIQGYKTFTDKETRLGSIQFFIPLGVFFIAAMTRYVFVISPNWQLELLQNTQPFGASYWLLNIAAFFDFALNPLQTAPNSIALSLMGLPAFLGTGIICLRTLSSASTENEKSKAFLLISFQITSLLFLLVIFSYHWGFVNSDVTSRFVLFPYFVFLISILFLFQKEPTYLFGLTFLLWIASGIFYLYEKPVSIPLVFFIHPFLLLYFVIIGLRKKSPALTPYCLVVFFSIYLVIETIPSISKRKYEGDYYPAAQSIFFQNWIKENSNKGNLFISKSPYYAVPLNESSTSFSYFEFRRDVILKHWREGRIPEIFIFQRCITDEIGTLSPIEDDRLEFEFEFEIVSERWFSGDGGARVIRWKGLKNPSLSPK